MPSIFRPYGNPFSASPAARISLVLHSSLPRLCVFFYQRALPWSITKVQDFFIDPHCICWHLLAAALLSLRLSRTAIAIALIFLLHLLQELLPLHIPLSGEVRHVYVRSYCISLHFLQPEFFPQKWQLTLAFNRTDLLLVRFRISVPPRIAIVVRLFVRRLKASCNCRLYYHRTGAEALLCVWMSHRLEGVVIAVSSSSSSCGTSSADLTGFSFSVPHSLRLPENRSQKN